MTSTDLHTHPGSPPEPLHQTHEHEHPSDLKYVKIAAFLAVITAIEVSTYWWDDWWDAKTSVIALSLMPMMVIKFAVVCAYFMHLKFDNPIFRRVFTFGLILAVLVYTAALTSMHFWSS